MNAEPEILERPFLKIAPIDLLESLIKTFREPENSNHEAILDPGSMRFQGLDLAEGMQVELDRVRNRIAELEEEISNINEEAH